MSSLKEISLAIKTLINCKVELMHCVSEYPTKYPKLNTIKLLKKNLTNQWDIRITLQILMTPALSVVAGAESIEKHFTYNKRQKSRRTINFHYHQIDLGYGTKNKTK